ncbi:unnamed protein product [Leuciscus chuanchicus]
MADTRPKRLRSDEQKAKNREREKERGRSRIYIGEAFERWRELRRQKGFQSDIQVALFLLDRYEGKSIPIPGRRRKRNSKAPAQSSYEGPTTLSECYDWGTDDEEEEEEEEEEEQKSDCYDSQDDEFVPRLCRRNDGALDDIGPDEIVYDVRDTEPPSTPPPIFPSPPEIFTEDDLTGKRASIAYEDCLKQLASFLTLPVKRCPYRCDVSHVRCQCLPPFQVSITCRGTASIMEWGNGRI